MVERNGFDGQTPILVNRLVAGSIDGMKHHVKLEPRTEKLHLRIKQRAQFGRCIHVKRTCSAQHAEGRNEPYQPEAVIAMQVRDENGLYFGKAYARTAELNLCAFAAVNHEKLAPYLNNLRRGIVSGCGQCAATTQNMNTKRFHE